MQNYQSLIEFLAELRENNNTVWFDGNRSRYKALREEFIDFTTEVHAGMLGFDPSLRHLNPRKSLFRINRDIRFSRDKTPYKTHIGAKFSATGQKKEIAGYGFGFSADGGLYIMAGINKLPTDRLNLIRDDLVNEESKLLDILLGFTQKQSPQTPFIKGALNEFELSDLGFGALKNIPRGYPKDFAYPELLKLQAFWAMGRRSLIPAQAGIHKKAFKSGELRDYILERFEQLQPMVTAMNEVLGAISN